MLQISLVGALGADAEKRTANGHDFISFNVASTERFTKADGTQAENTTWVSCTINGDGGKLLQYLRRGTIVYVSGRGSTRVYSSPKERRMVAGINLMVDAIELVGGRPDAVPGRLVTPDGLLVEVRKAYYVNPDQWQGLLPADGQYAYLYGERGGEYLMNSSGYVVPSNLDPKEPSENTESTEPDNQPVGTTEQAAEQPKETSTKRSKKS